MRSMLAGVAVFVLSLCLIMAAFTAVESAIAATRGTVVPPYVALLTLLLSASFALMLAVVVALIARRPSR